MNNNLNNTLDSFLNKETPKQPEQKDDASNQEVLKQKDGLIERIDKTFITESGKILLRD
jgi:hypothetical protein